MQGHGDFGWLDDAACAGADPALFFGQTREQTHAALRLCASCPVADVCRQWADTQGYEQGVFGGLQPHQRVEAAGRPGVPVHRSGQVNVGDQTCSRPPSNVLVGSSAA